MFDFPQIAATAKRLSVGTLRRSAIKNGDDMVEFQKLSRVAVGARLLSPFPSLQGRELFAVPSKFWRFVESVRFSAWHGFNHLAALFCPKFFRRFSYAPLCFVAVAIAFGVIVPKVSAFSIGRDFGLGRIAVTLSPERVSGANILFSRAGSGTGWSRESGELPFGAVEGLRADRTRQFLTVLFHRFGPIENAVNSGESLDTSPQFKSILSQAQAGMPEKVQRLEAETRAVGNASTSAAPEREDIVRAACIKLKTQNRGIKSLRDNISDDIVDTTPIDGVTSSFWPWRQMATSISINDLEREQNSGEYQMVDLLETKTQQAMDGIREKFAKALMQGNGINTATAITTAYTSPTNGSVFIDPLPLLVGTSPTTGTIGSIAANVSDGGVNWWANQVTHSVATTFAGLLKELDNLRNKCARGVGGFPDMHIVDQSVYEVYVAALRNQNRYTDTTRADIPFDNVAFHRQPVTWDEFMPNWIGGTTVQNTAQGSWLMLNSKCFQIKYSKKTNFRVGDFIRPENQFCDVALVGWTGASGVTNRRKHGVLDTIVTTMSA